MQFWRILDSYNQRCKIENYFYEIKKFCLSVDSKFFIRIGRLHFITNLAYLLMQLLPQIQSAWQKLAEQRPSLRVEFSLVWFKQPKSTKILRPFCSSYQTWIQELGKIVKFCKVLLFRLIYGISEGNFIPNYNF